MRYRPYGEDRDAGSTLNTDRKFTGQTEDEAAGLYWYASRAYDPAIGRFVSPDSIVPEPLKPLLDLTTKLSLLNPLIMDLMSLDTVALEQQAQRIQSIYKQNPWLPAPWLFPLAGR